MTHNKRILFIIIPIILITTIFCTLVVHANVFAEVPPLAVNISFITTEDGILNIPAPGVLFNTSDMDGNPLTAIEVTDAAHGTLILDTNGSFTYVPTTDYNGTDSFTFKANDGMADSNTATVYIMVTAVNDAPSFTKGGNQTIVENSSAQTIANWATSISAGPPDESGQILNFVIDNNSNPDLFSVLPAISSSGTLTYTPAINTLGSAIIMISLRDNGGTYNGAVDTSPPQTFSITITEVVNTPPMASNDSYTTDKNAILNTTAPGVLTNDTDAGGNSLTTIKVTDPSHGTLILNADGSFTYTPTTDYTGADSFIYKANNGTADSNTTTVSITVNSETTSILNPGTTDVSTSIDKNGTCTKKVEAISDDSQTSLVIEPGTTCKTAGGLSLSQLTINKSDALQNLTTGVSIISSLYECGPSGVTFNPPVTIKLSYDPTKIPAGVSDTDLAVGFYDNQAKTWQKLASTVDPATYSVTAQVGHLTLFAVISELSPAPTPLTPTLAAPTSLSPDNLMLSELKISPTEILVGKAIKINVVATNSGGTTGSYVVTLRIDGASITSKNIYLEAGQSLSLTFTTSQNAVGNHIVKINDLASTIDVKPESSITNAASAKLPWPVLGIACMVFGFIATFLFISTKRKHSLKVQTENGANLIALEENLDASIQKKPTPTMIPGNNHIEKVVSEVKTTFTEITMTPAKLKILKEDDQKPEVAESERKETTQTGDRQTIESNIFRELEHNLIIATTPIGDKLIPFDTTRWKNIHLETEQVLLTHQEEIARIYANIDLANTVVTLANRFEHRSEAVNQSYLKLCVKVAEQIKALTHQ